MNLVDLQDALGASKRAFNRELINQLNTVCMEVGREYVTYADDNVYQRDLDNPDDNEKVTIMSSTVLDDGTIVLTVDTDMDLAFGTRTEVRLGLTLLKLYIEYNKNLLEMALVNETARVATVNKQGNDTIN